MAGTDKEPKSEPSGIDTGGSGGGSSSVTSTTRKLVPEVYTYKTDRSVEDFGKVPFDSISRPRNDLSPPPAFIPPKPQPPKSTLEFCKNNPTHPKCVNELLGENRPSSYCQENPSDPRCNDEHDPYTDLGLFQEEVRYIFDPAKRSDENVNKKPVSNLYESKQDDTQLDVPHIIRTECRCKNGTIALGYLDTTTGQKDCSPCNNRVRAYSNPSIYKNYQTKKKRTNFSDKKVPLREQVGVSSFGDVEMRGCQTGNADQSLERVNASKTLNQVVNVDTLDSRGGANITAKQNTSALPISIYDTANTNIYGL